MIDMILEQHGFWKAVIIGLFITVLAVVAALFLNNFLDRKQATIRQWLLTASLVVIATLFVTFVLIALDRINYAVFM